MFHPGKNLKERLVTLEGDLLKLTDELQQEAQCVPNMTHPDVPVGGEDCSTIRKMVYTFSCFNIFLEMNCFTFLLLPFSLTFQFTVCRLANLVNLASL